MSELIKSIIILPILDLIYIKLMSSKFTKQIEDVQGSKVNVRIISGVLCYIALLVSINVFILQSNETREKKILKAFILGMCGMAIYETTNYAFFDKWYLETVIIDTIWGGILFSLTTFLVTL